MSSVVTARAPRAGAIVAPVLVLGLALIGVATSAPVAVAAPLEVSAGWARSDIGLDQQGDGLALGIGTRVPLGERPWDLVCALEYVQKSGTQPTLFTTETNPSFRDDASVTLHVVQPVALLELRALPSAWPRPYAGLSVALKLGESWSDFPGDPSTQWGYQDLDFVAHGGLAWSLGRARLDARYSQGLTDQLLVDPALPAAAKATDPLAGVKTPEPGSRVSTWQFGLAWTF